MDENNLDIQQIPQIKKQNKVFKIIIMILIFVLALALILYFWKPYLLMKVEIDNKKDSYKLGEAITLIVEINNYSFFPFTKVFGTSNTDPDLSIEGIEPPYRYHMSLAGPGSTTVEIDPFGSKKYTAQINLVNEQSWTNDAGTMSNYDLAVKPGENKIIAEWGKRGSINFYIAPEDFYDDKIDCNLFFNPIRKDQCNLDFVRNGVASLESCMNIQNDFSRAICISDLAVQKKDSSICNEIEDDYDRDGCIWDIYFDTKDPKYCKEMKDPSGCYYNYAQEAADSSFCELIPEQEAKTRCYSLFK